MPSESEGETRPGRGLTKPGNFPELDSGNKSQLFRGNHCGFLKLLGLLEGS